MKKNLAVVLIALIGCGGSQSQPIESMIHSPNDAEKDVEDVSEASQELSQLEASQQRLTAVYQELFRRRLAVANCQAARAVAEERSAIIELAEQDLERLLVEFSTYYLNYLSGHDGPHCGLVCEEIKDFLRLAEEKGLISCRLE